VKKPLFAVIVSFALAGSLLAQGQPPESGQRGRGRGPQPRPARKQLLVWCDTTGGGLYHDSVSHAMAVIEKLGRDSGVYDAYLRTDSQLITKQRTVVHADGRDWPVTKTLDYFDAIFFCGLREIPLSDQQFKDLLSFVHDDGKGFVAAHAADTAFVSRPEFAKMMGSSFDNHPWNQIEAKVINEDPDFPATKHFPAEFTFRDEMYQVKDFSREESRVLLRLDPNSVDLKNPNVHRTDGDFPQAWVKMYGKGRVFVCAFGHDTATWDNPDIQKMWLEAIKWSLGLTNADITPRPLPKK
jgi:type 1 glutamine amidotransferase